jgi:hypothetical protein
MAAGCAAASGAQRHTCARSLRSGTGCHPPAPQTPAQTPTKRQQQRTDRESAQHNTAVATYQGTAATTASAVHRAAVHCVHTATRAQEHASKHNMLHTVVSGTAGLLLLLLLLLSHHAVPEAGHALHLQRQLVVLHLPGAACRLLLAAAAGGHVREVATKQRLHHAAHFLHDATCTHRLSMGIRQGVKICCSCTSETIYATTRAGRGAEHRRS